MYESLLRWVLDVTVKHVCFVAADLVEVVYEDGSVTVIHRNGNEWHSCTDQHSYADILR